MRLAASGAHVDEPGVHRFTGRRITVAADRPLPLCVDGDEAGLLPATVQIRPRTLRVITP